MPTRSWFRRTAVDRLVGLPRRLSALPAGLTLPVALAGLLSVPGCRADSSSARLSPLHPAQWAQHRGHGESADLQPVPSVAPAAPPLPGSAAEDPFGPGAEPETPLAPRAPGPEPGGEADLSYGVQQTSAELEAPREPSWTNRFRSLFRRDTPAGASGSPIRSAAASRDKEAERPSGPPKQRITQRSTIRLGVPEFDSAPAQMMGPSREPSSVRTVAQTEPARLARIRRPEPLPVITPGRPSVESNTQGGTQEWPYAVAEQPQPVPEPPPTLLAPEASPPAPLRSIAEPPGPVLLR